MTSDRVLAPTAGGEDEERLLTSLRPRSLADFIGQDMLRQRLSIALEAARQRREPLDHVLLGGPPGLGKTTLAHIVAHEMRGNLITTSGPAVEKTLDLMGMLTGLEPGDVFFVDEIHRMPRTIEEYLYPAMEDFKVDFIIDKGPFARAYPMSVHPFTLIGATTRKGLLSSPLRERFGLNFELDFYSVDDLRQIVSRSAGLLNVVLQAPAAEEIARRSRGTPRIANRLLRRVRDYAQVHQVTDVGLGLVDDALTLEGVDKLGLDDLDRRYLTTLVVQYQGGPAGVSALANTMQQETDTLEEVVEPYLLHDAFVLRTPAGRRATPKAYAHLGVSQARKAGSQQPLPLEGE